MQSSVDMLSGTTSKNVNSKKLTFAYSFKPIYYFSRIFGFMPFSVVHDSTGAIQLARVRTVDFLWFIISIGIYVSSAIHLVVSIDQTPIPDKSIILVNCTRSIVVIRKLLSCLSIILDMSNRSKIVDILKKISSFDERVSQFWYLSTNIFNSEELFCECRWQLWESTSIMEKSVDVLWFFVSWHQ